MAESYVKQDEIDAMNASNLKRDTPFMIRGVSGTQLSIARYYGAAKYNGASYTYLGESDELIRDDVLKWLTKLRKPTKRPKTKTQQMKQKTTPVT